MALTEAHLWAMLSAPVCALFAVRNASAFMRGEAEHYSPSRLHHLGLQVPRSTQHEKKQEESEKLGPLVEGASLSTSHEDADWRVALIAAIAIFAAAWSAPSALAAIASVVFLSGLCHLAIVDRRLMLVPVRLSLALIAAGLGFAFLEAGAANTLASSGAAFAGWASYRLLDLLYLRLRGRSGLGAGDALVAAAIGAWLGLQGLAWCTALGGALTLARVVAQRGTETARRSQSETGKPVAFVPGLAGAAFVVLMFEHWA